ncbi:MAG: helix-turn-helix domain-containing protein, partial [Desulfosalsimonas sp.]
GNIRELKNVIERLVIMSDRRFLDMLYLMDNLKVNRSADKKPVPDTLAELKAVKKQIISENFGQVEKAFVIKALREAGGNISRAASAVGMQRSNFHALMNKHQIQNSNP